MIFEELRAFLAVVEQGWFLSAAAALGVSRATLRRQVDALEASAGVTLLHRHRSGVRATEAGQKLLSGGRLMQQEFTALLRSIREAGHRPSGQVRILLPTGLPPRMLATLLELLRTNWPELGVQLRLSEAPLSQDLSEIDAVVWFGGVQPSSAWETHTVLRARQCLLADASYLAARGTPRSLEDLHGHDLLAWIAPDETTPRIVARNGETLPIRPALATADVHLIHECVRRGSGLGWAPDARLPAQPAEPSLVTVLEDLVGRDVLLRLAVPRSLAGVPKVRVLIDQLEAMRAVVFEQAPPPGRPRR